MAKIILIGILIIALIVGVGSVVFYNSQSYDFEISLKENIPAKDIFVRSSSNRIWNGTDYVTGVNRIETFSVNLGEMNFENKGVLDQVIEFPKLAACLDLSSATFNAVPTPGSVFWPTYSLNEPVFNNTGLIYEPSNYYGNTRSEIYAQNIYGNSYRNYNYGNPVVEIKPDEKLTYYISLKNAYLYIDGDSSDIFKGSKIKVYEIPTKEYNPLSDGVTYDSLIYNPDCMMLGREFEPVKTISVI